MGDFPRLAQIATAYPIIFFNSLTLYGHLYSISFQAADGEMSLTVLPAALLNSAD